jgi:uncharacterized protein involved in exopolysaccharide biosynthesis
MEQADDSIQINFKALGSVLWGGKWLIIGISTLFTLLGLGYAYSLKEEFVAEGKILPEIQSQGGSIGQFAGLAALAGFNLGSAAAGTDAVRPDLYPDVLKSTPFFLRLFDEKILDRQNIQQSFLAFYQKEVLENQVKSEDQQTKFAKSPHYLTLSRQTEKNIQDLQQRIVCTYDKKTGIIGIRVKMPDPVVAAGVAAYSMQYLTDYIVSYRTEKQNRDLSFIADRLQAAKGKYYTNQSKKAAYTDQMPLSALRLQAADLQRERLEADYRISSSFYNSLLQKYEETKLKMQQETPIIKVLEPPSVPNLKAEPKKSVIMISSSFLGLLFSTLISLFRKKNYLKIIS